MSIYAAHKIDAGTPLVLESDYVRIQRPGEAYTGRAAHDIERGDEVLFCVQDGVFRSLRACFERVRLGA